MLIFLVLTQWEGDKNNSNITFMKNICLLKAYLIAPRTSGLSQVQVLQSYMKKHLTFNYIYTKINIIFCLHKSKNNAFAIGLVYNSNKAGTCWYC